MSSKKKSRIRRAQKTRHNIRVQEKNRLCVHRTPRHIYAQIINSTGSQTLVSASTLEVEVRGPVKNGGNVTAAAEVGKRIAEKAKAAGIEELAFDRSGFKYHGRIKALADAARENGLKI